MNKTYRSLWNAALGAWVATPENVAARGKRARSTSRTTRAFVLTGLMCACCAGIPVAHAAGGTGGRGGGINSGSPGGAGGDTGQAGTTGGLPDFTNTGGGGGGGGGSGAAPGGPGRAGGGRIAGGAAGQAGDGQAGTATVTNASGAGGGGGGAGGANGQAGSGTVSIATNLAGGAGFAGGAGGDSTLVPQPVGDSSAGGGGGGGAGGIGLLGDGATAATIGGAVVTGGRGGNGGAGGNGFNGIPDAGAAGGGGGGGGDGGEGAMLTTTASTLANAGTLAGGAGGAGGLGGKSSQHSWPGGAGGKGGDGGAGFRATASGITLNNTGTIQGGAGGMGGVGQPGQGGDTNPPGATGAAGLGGAGVIGADLAITNSGTIAGGLAADGVTRANAISFTGGSNSLTLQAGSVLTGAIGVAGSVSFNQSTDVALTNAITGTGSVIQNGAGTLTLSGNNTYQGGTTLGAGTLAISADAGLGAAAGALVFDGGTLRTTANITMQRATTLDAPGGTIETNANTTLTQQGHVTGTGGLTKTGTGTLLLASSGNDYRGPTQVNAGTLQAGAVNAFAGASAFTVASGAALDLGNFDQTIGSLAGAGDVRLGSATLTTGGDATSTSHAGTISGTGGLTKTGAGALTLGGTNSSYSGTTTVSAGTLIGRAASFGSGAIVDNAALVIDQPVDATLANAISGTGTLTKTGSGTLTLSGANSYSGGTALDAGRLAIGNDTALGTGALAMAPGTTLAFAGDGLTLSNPIAFTAAGDPTIDTGSFTATVAGAITGPGDLTKTGSGTLILSGPNSYSGVTNVSQGTLQAGALNTFSPASAHSVAAGATLDLAGFSQSVAGLTNGGTVSLIGSTPGTTLIVTGPYVGNNGTLRLSTALGDSTSASDRLVLNGPAAVASGRTTVQVVNANGLGALTSGNGIELVSALNGATTTAQSTRDAFALQGGHVDAGAYAYTLQPGDAVGAGENWYLRSTSTVPVPPPPAPPPPAPPAPAPAPSPAPSPAPAPAPAPGPSSLQVPSYRAEVPLFAALPEQLRQDDLNMLSNLHQRIGDDDMQAAAANVQRDSASVPGERRAWARILSTRQDMRQSGTVSPHSQGSRSGVQAGTDLLADAHRHAGLYVGQLDGDMSVDGFARGQWAFQAGHTNMQSQYLGGYATWTGDSGLYADAVLQAARHRYDLQALDSVAVHGKARSLSASLEVGRPFALGESGWQIEPQLQLVRQRMTVDDITIPSARVQQDPDSGWLVRGGVRIKGDIATRAGRLQPYARINVYRSSGGGDIARFITPTANTAIASRTGGTSTELAAGFTLALSPTTSVYGELGHLAAAGGDARVKSSVGGSLGIRVRW